MDTLMNAAKAADVSLNPTVKGYKESKINMFKFTRIIGKVFVRIAPLSDFGNPKPNIKE